MIIVTSTFTADVMRPYMESLLNKFCNQKTKFIYNQLFQQAMLPNSEFNQNNNGLNVLLIRLTDLFANQHNNEATHQTLADLVNALNQLQKTMRVPLLILFTPTIHTTQKEEAYYLECENILQSKIQFLENTLLFTSRQMTQQANIPVLFDKLTEKYGHIPYTLEFYNTLSYFITRNYSLLTRKPYKVIVLDCDGTLWHGIIGEDGPNGIRIHNHFSQLHQFIIKCYEAGFLICLCSKNSEESVLSVFKHHKDMLLNFKIHICTYRVNWELKSTNIKSIATELNIGLDSFIFIDDNTVECMEVKSKIPEVLVIHLPKNVKKRVPYLKNIWAFDHLKKGIEDKQRTEFYQTNRLRRKLQSESPSFEQFLASLKIQTILQAATTDDYNRIFQLSQRTNQFNFFPNAITDIELSHAIRSGMPCCLTIRVTDKFSDYGLVGVIIYVIKDAELVINTFLLSCRILGRGIEYQMIREIGKIAELNQAINIRISFKITNKNTPAINFIKQISGLKELTNINSITLSTEAAKLVHISYIEIEEKPLLHSPLEKSGFEMSNDFMLEIAKNFIKKTTVVKHKR